MQRLGPARRSGDDVAFLVELDVRSAHGIDVVGTGLQIEILAELIERYAVARILQRLSKRLLHRKVLDVRWQDAKANHDHGQHHCGHKDEADDREPALPMLATHTLSPSTNAAADPLERQAADIVPIEPDKKCFAADMVIGHKTPIATVIAVVAIITHHQVVAGRHLAAKALLIVNAVLATRERPHILWVDRLRGGILGDGVKMVARALLKELRRH